MFFSLKPSDFFNGVIGLKLLFIDRADLNIESLTTYILGFLNFLNGKVLANQRSS